MQLERSTTPIMNHPQILFLDIQTKPGKFMLFARSMKLIRLETNTSKKLFLDFRRIILLSTYKSVESLFNLVIVFI